MTAIIGNLFDRLANVAATHPDLDPFTEGITELMGEGTPYEAAIHVHYNDGDCDDWSGFIVFKDSAFSPLLHDILQLQYITPAGASGAVARARAVTLWETLVSVFKGLEGKRG